MTKTALPQTCIEYWAERGHDVGPGGERIIAGLPESVNRLTPHSGRARMRGSMHLSVIKKTPETFNAKDRLKANLADTKVKLGNARARITELELRVLKHEARIKELNVRLEGLDKLTAEFPNTAAKISELVSDIHRIPVAEILGKSRTTPVFIARAHLAGLLKERLFWSFSRIGRFIGGRDHTTIINAYNRFQEYRLDGTIVIAVDVQSGSQAEEVQA